MSKRVLEFTCGDPKSNQQTASKVDMVVNINNTNAQQKPAGKKVTVQRSKAEDLENEIEIFNNTDVEGVDDSPKDSSDDTAEVKNLHIKVPVNRDVAPVPKNSDRFYVTARNPPVLREEILGSSTVKDCLIGILTEMLIHDDLQLLANICDRSGKIVLKAEDFNNLLAVILSANGNQITPKDIKVRYNEDIITSCFKVKISPFKHIVSIQVGDQDLKLHQYEAYNALTNDFNISAEVVYIPDVLV